MPDPAPIVLIGAARSGTKFLRDVLAVADGVRAVPYDVNYVWRYGAEDAPDDALDPAGLTERRADYIRKTLRDLAGAGPGEVLLEKTVSNTLRIPFVDQVMPDARYIHLVRDGRDVAESAMRQWRAPPDWPALLAKLRGLPRANLGYAAWFGRNLVRGMVSGRGGGSVWGPRFPGIADCAASEPLAAVCARQWVESVTHARRDLAALPDAARRVIEIRYDRLVRDETVLRDLVARLGLGDAARIVAAFREKVQPPPPRRWHALPEADLEAFGRIMGPALAINGFVP
jgi:Sulfotransferase family